MDHELTEVWDAARRRQLLAPLLLYVSSHAPLAFVAGQALYVVAPLAALLGWRAPQGWAGQLSLAHAGAGPQDAHRP